MSSQASIRDLVTLTMERTDGDGPLKVGDEVECQVRLVNNLKESRLTRMEVTLYSTPWATLLDASGDVPEIRFEVGTLGEGVPWEQTCRCQITSRAENRILPEHILVRELPDGSHLVETSSQQIIDSEETVVGCVATGKLECPPFTWLPVALSDMAKGQVKAPELS
jgi:hypothetical protein